MVDNPLLPVDGNLFTYSPSGPLVRIAPGWVVCSDPAEIRRIWSINSGYYRGNWYKASRLNPNEDNVLTVSDNKAHHRLRAILGPAYAAMGNMEAKTHDQGMEATHEQIVDGQIEKLLALLERKYLSTPGGALQPCNIARIMQYLTQDVITTIGYGKAAGYLDVDKDIFGVIEACETVLLPAHLISFLPTLQNLLATPLLRPFIPKPTDTHPIGRFLAFIKAHVDEHYANNDEKNRSDVLHTFVNSKLSPTEVESEALVLLFGGTDTTATGLRNIIFFLSTNPRAYRLLQAEIDAAVQYGSRPIISDKHAKQLPYLQACIREGLRLWPPSMGVMGKISDRDNIVCGMKIPAGTQVGWAALPIMKDRSVFGDDAHVFEPARWIDADPAKSKEMEAVYGLVFATGTRWECLGKKLAYVELGKVIFEVSFPLFPLYLPILTVYPVLLSFSIALILPWSSQWSHFVG